MDPTNIIFAAKTSQRLDESVNAAQTDCTGRMIAHLRHRTAETLAAIEPAPGLRRVRTWGLRPLGPAEYAHAMRQSPDADPRVGLTYDQCAEAFAMAVVAIRHPDGSDESVSQATAGKLTVSPQSFVDRVFAATYGGAGLIAELGALAIQRAQIGDAGPFFLPPGTTLGR